MDLEGRLMRTLLLAFTFHGLPAYSDRSPEPLYAGDAARRDNSGQRKAAFESSIVRRKSSATKRNGTEETTAFALLKQTRGASIARCTGRVSRSTANPITGLGALEEVRRTVEQVSQGKNYKHRLMGYNNDPSTTFADIKKVLSTTDETITARQRRRFLERTAAAFSACSTDVVIEVRSRSRESPVSYQK